MLWILSIVLSALWAFALITSHTFGGYVHVLAILAVAMLAASYMHNHGENSWTP